LSEHGENARRILAEREQSGVFTAAAHRAVAIDLLGAS
jgi:hypothetical protein